MKLLKEGYSAIEGVEAAIKVLEDKEITNAGFGSNLAVDGTVECDATLVDHLGRSGACGAVPSRSSPLLVFYVFARGHADTLLHADIKNPISLAKLILQESHKPLTLRRVPPNLLVGKGAKDFAWEHGMPLVPNEWLVSRNAKDRYMRWKDDLDHADTKATAATNIEHRVPDADYNEEIRYKKNQRDHANAIATGTWNEGQPDSPAQPATPSENSSSAMQLGSPLKSGTLSTQGPSSPRAPKAPGERSPLSFLGSLGSPRASSPGSPGPGSPVFKIMRHSGGRRAEAAVSGNNSADQTDVREKAASPISLVRPGSPRKCALQASEDRITDTVGAIAIDQRGDMAAGSSSGGIGMKHRGRVGPAALVGIGTAIIPANADDEDRLVVGAVTSGTGEHMATTQASQRCAERLYHGTRRGIDGRDVEEPEESVVMESFITHDFQNHPGVLQSSSSSAIGAMAVKQTRNGYYLYFAHNTDSFALASMSSTDRNPNCVMSRLPEGSTGVAQGARKIRVE